MKPLAALAILAISVGQLDSATQAGILWDTRRLLGDEMRIHDLAHDHAGNVVAVGINGTIRTSTDHGNNWSAPLHPSKLDLRAVCWTGSEWLAGGDHTDTSSVILTSTDASSWIETCLGSHPSTECLATAGPHTVALGLSGALARSTDNSFWITSTDGTQSIRDVIWTGTQYVAVGEAGAIKTSPDGLTWTAQTSGVPDVALLGVAWNGTALVAVGHDDSFQSHVLRSTDGITWDLLPAGSLPGFFGTTLLVECTGTSFIVVGLGLGQAMASTSPDGLTWSTAHELPSSWIVAPVPHALCWTHVRLVMAGGGGQILVTNNPTPTATADWEIREPAGAPWRLFDLAMANVSGTDRIVIVGDQFTVLISDDNGTGITEITSGTGPSAPALRAITSTTLPTRKFIAVGRDGTIVTSADGGTWFEETSNTTNELRDITWFEPISPGTKVAVAVGADGEIRSSANGSSWADRSVATLNDLNGVAGGTVIVEPSATSRLVAVGENGAVYISSSGTTWTASSSTPTVDLLAVTALDNGFVAVGDGGAIFTSPNGLTWTSRHSPTDQPLHDVTWTGTQVVAVGGNGTVLTSPDGITWARRYSSHPKSLNGILPLLSGRLGAVGDEGIVITSNPAMDFADWISAQGPPVGQDGPDDDPNGDGVTNQVAYAHGIPAVAAPPPGALQALPRLIDPGPSGQLRMQLKPNPSFLGDQAYIIEESTTLLPGSWTEVLRHSPGQSCSSGSLTVTSDESLGITTIEFPEITGSRPGYFARLRTEFVP